MGPARESSFDATQLKYHFGEMHERKFLQKVPVKSCSLDIYTIKQDLQLHKFYVYAFKNTVSLQK